jgi:transcriptional regulator with XRE-family HTH domain
MTKVKAKSLGRLAKDLGVSHSFLSQIKHGKRPISAGVVSEIRKIDKQRGLQNDKILHQFTFGEVSELADEHDLGSCAARRRGSSPLFPIGDR